MRQITITTPFDRGSREGHDKRVNDELTKYGQEEGREWVKQVENFSAGYSWATVILLEGKGVQ